MKNKLKIDCMIAFVITDDDGNEGVMGITNGDVCMPLVGADINRAKSWIPVAESIKKHSGRDYKIVKFSQRSELDKNMFHRDKH